MLILFCAILFLFAPPWFSRPRHRATLLAVLFAALLPGLASAQAVYVPSRIGDITGLQSSLNAKAAVANLAVNVRDYGANPDGRFLEGCSVTNGSNVVTVNLGSARNAGFGGFTAADVGKIIVIGVPFGAGQEWIPAYQQYEYCGYIKTVTNANTITLATTSALTTNLNVTVTSTSAGVRFGTDNTAAFQSALNLAGAINPSKGEDVLVPAGHYMFARQATNGVPILKMYTGTRLIGQGTAVETPSDWAYGTLLDFGHSGSTSVGSQAIYCQYLASADTANRGGVVFRDLAFLGPSSSNTLQADFGGAPRAMDGFNRVHGCIATTYAAEISLEGCWFWGFSIPVEALFSRNIRVSECYFRRPSIHAVALYGCVDIEIVSRKYMGNVSPRGGGANNNNRRLFSTIMFTGCEVGRIDIAELDEAIPGCNILLRDGCKNINVRVGRIYVGEDAGTSPANLWPVGVRVGDSQLHWENAAAGYACSDITVEVGVIQPYTDTATVHPGFLAVVENASGVRFVNTHFNPRSGANSATLRSIGIVSDAGTDTVYENCRIGDTADRVSSAARGVISRALSGTAAVALKRNEVAAGVLQFTGSPTATIAITAPLVKGERYLLHNASSQGITFGHTTGTAVAVAAGARARVYFDGTNVVTEP